MTIYFQGKYAKSSKKIKEEVTDRPFRDRTDAENRIRDVAGSVIGHYVDYIFPEAYEIIKQKVLFSADVEYQIKRLTGESNLQHKIYPLIDSTHDTFVSNLYDSETTPTAIPRFKEAIQMTKDANAFYDWAVSVSGIESEENLIGAEAALIGTSYAIFGLKENNTYNNPNESLDDQEPTSTQVPHCAHVSFFELFLPPGTTDFDNSRFKFRRKLLTCKQISELYGFIDLNEDISTRDGSMSRYDFIERTCGEALYNRDFNRIRQIKDYENVYKQKCMDKNLDWELYDSSVYQDMFQVVKGEGGIHEVIEYRSGINLVVMVNGYIHYDGDHPYGGQDPFSCIVFEKQPGTYRGRGIGQKLMPLQKEANMLFSAVNNGIKMHLMPDYAITKGSLKDPSGGDITNLRYQGGKVYEIPAGNVLSSEPFKAIHFVEYDVLALADRRLQEINIEAQTIIGTNSYTQGGQGKVERSAGAVNRRVAVTQTRLNPIVQSLNKFREKSFYAWLYICATEFDDDLIARVIGPDGSVAFYEMNPSDLLNKFDMVVDRETAVSIRRADAVANTIQTLNAMAPYLVDSNGLPTIDVRDTLTKMLHNSLMIDIDPLDEAGIKKLIDMKLSVEKYIGEKTQAAPGLPQPGSRNPSTAELDQLASNIPPRGLDATPEQIEALGL